MCTDHDRSGCHAAPGYEGQGGEDRIGEVSTAITYNQLVAGYQGGPAVRRGTSWSVVVTGLRSWIDGREGVDDQLTTGCGRDRWPGRKKDQLVGVGEGNRP